MSGLGLARESWTWYGLTWVVVVARMVSRILLRGSITKLQADDLLVVFAMACDTVLIAGMNIISHTNSNLIDPADTSPLTPESIAEREYGSKWVLVVEQMQCIVIWTVKICFLLMFNRLTITLRQNIAVMMVAAYVIVGFIVMEALYLAVWCRPFHQYWAVPPDNVQCSAATNHLITNTVLNISSDILIILIPMPVLLQSQIPRKRKLILCGVFALGMFTILCAVLNKYYSFTEPFGQDWTFWYIRESSTALIVANLPLTWTVLRRIFNLKAFDGGKSSSCSHRRYGRTGPAPGGGRRNTNGGVGQDASDSQERINGGVGGYPHTIPLRIYQRQEVEVRSHRAMTLEERDEESIRGGGGGIVGLRSKGVRQDV
ncbi:hypothetical protein SODALDRAFT_330164 [Sodiomyces alkalinus F11]|uniref:Rhodopsin domain-containing protein n=1 Tax=Sodiomyces alkalinus (strain CBS 110278 / VKM F-3762 / F11) TaxID=1314773 RepID=A0A3N2Q111_SODAK|nr:hypothetical protein SODALDRAFT_330164 [Sodiomyces alkalinus F11]ROT40449.1 hypothetical protein SODALDRAFT_330164 [Sodiomyces alkalinus F11]